MVDESITDPSTITMVVDGILCLVNPSMANSPDESIDESPSILAIAHSHIYGIFCS